MLCKICHKQISESNGAHFWREHRIKREDYFHKYHPKYDLLTKELIPFNSYEQYFSSYFVNQINFKKWIKIQDVETQKRYCKKILLKRKELKNIEYSPTHVELRSLPQFPSIVFYNKLFNNYYDLCQSLRLKNKHEYFDAEQYINEDPYLLNKKPAIQIDTREQKILKFDVDIEIATLNFGDYRLNDPNLNGNIYIERKSLTDFLSSFGKNNDRLRKEFERAYNENAYIFIVVEEMLNRALYFDSLPWVSKKIQTSPEFVFHNVREMSQTFPNIQFLFSNGRKEASRIVKKLLYAGEKIKKIDCQLAYDLSIL